MLFGRLRERILLKSVLHVLHDYFSLFNQSDLCFLVSSLPSPSSLLQLSISGDVLVSAAVVAASSPYLLSNTVPSPCQDGPRYFVGQEVDVPMEIPEGVDDVSAAVYDPDGNLMRSTFRREADGLFHLRFTPTKAGMHKVS